MAPNCGIGCCMAVFDRIVRIGWTQRFNCSGVVLLKSWWRWSPKRALMYLRYWYMCRWRDRIRCPCSYLCPAYTFQNVHWCMWLWGLCPPAVPADIQFPKLLYTRFSLKVWEISEHLMDVLLIAGACYRPVQEQAVAVCSCIYAFAVIVSSKLGLHARECFSLGKDDSVLLLRHSTGEF